MNPVAQKVEQVYSDSFSTQPTMFFSPGRINLIGEHVDYNDGFVMPAAINKGVYYAIGLNNSEEIHFYSLDFDEWLSVNVHEIRKIGTWKNYVLGVVNEFIKAGYPIKGFDCVFGGDIPRGSGLSSSAAVEGGVAFALNEMFSCGLSRIELAKICQKAEHDFPNVQCGIMDQFANMMGKENQVILLDCKDLHCQYFPLNLGEYQIILLNSMVHHSLVQGEYNQRRLNCEKGLGILSKELGINSFREIKDVSQLNNLKKTADQNVFECCLYVLEEINRTQKAAEYLKQNNIKAFGQLMNATHEGLSKLYKVSCPELDFLANTAIQYESVLGSRMMGGGFGGCTINIVRKDSVNQWIKSMSTLYEESYRIKLESYIVSTGNGTQAMLH